MQTYVTQLLAELAAAERRERPEKPDYKALYPKHHANHPMYEGTMDYMIEWENEKYYKMDELFGVANDAFPPAEKLTDAEMESIVAAVLKLWLSHQVDTNMRPESAPIQVVYTFIVQYWRRERLPVMYEEGDILTVDLCDYNTELCAWGEHCECKTIYADEDWTMPDSYPDDELPF